MTKGNNKFWQNFGKNSIKNNKAPEIKSQEPCVLWWAVRESNPGPTD